MHKITKGLKKKKKGKKSKHKDDELFKPEELEAYRREHQQPQQPAETGESSSTEKAATGENEEWKKFLVLTSGVDDILKKTQGDLDRIKSTSFFQRVPTASEVKKREDEVRQTEEKRQEEQRELQEQIAVVQAAIVEVSESESEEEDEDDIFDTAYIDAITTGEVKLAYIPESPTEEPDDDPFDTSIADKAILGPLTDRKGKKLVPIGSAVDILTGRVQGPTCVATKRPSPRRQIVQQTDLLLDNFEQATVVDEPLEVADNKTEKLFSLLDDDAPEDLTNEPIDLSKSFVLEQAAYSQSTANEGSNLVQEFENPPVTLQDDEEDLEFALLAAESLSRAPVQVVAEFPPIEPTVVAEKESWNAFDQQQAEPVEEIEEDPFDTTFADNILPGQAELKQIENEILNSTDNDFDFNPRAGEQKYQEIIKSTVSIQLTNPTGERESITSYDRISEEELNVIKPSHRDLLGGSSTDLSQLTEQPLQPNEQSEENSIEYSDPFDTSIVDISVLPGQTELKFLEQELLADINKVEVQLTKSLSDEDFDPRGIEVATKEELANAIQNRKVSFDLPLPKSDLLSLEGDDSSKNSKPLTPYYVRDNSIPEEEYNDPFDTGFVGSIAPGQVELKLIENELIHQADQSIRHSISDSDFNPRDEQQVNVAKVVQSINNLPDPTLGGKPANLVFQEEEKVDLLSVGNDISSTKVLTPQDIVEDLSDAYIDPFDTSIACNILPGQAELKLLETELIHSSGPINRVLTDPEFDPRNCFDSVSGPQDFFNPISDIVSTKILTPVSFSIGDEEDDIDPFDTSIANNIAPGPSELKIIESELI